MEAGHSTVRATVRALEGGVALVEVEQGGCGRCHEKGGCGGQNLTQMLCTSPKVYRAENRIGAAVGERVLIDIEPGSVRASANLAYGVPLLACVLGAVLGTQLADDLGGILGALGGLSLAFGYVRSRARLGNAAGHPYIVSRS